MADEQTEKPTCGNCRFRVNTNGTCRRHAPIGIDKNGHAEWPRVQSFYWCGDHEPAINEEGE